MRYAVTLALLLASGLALAQTTRSYQADPSDFLNPERGFYNFTVLLNADDLSSIRADSGHTLVYSYVRLDAYRAAPLPQSLLDDIDTKLAVVRRDGLKIVLRFAYNEDESGLDAPSSRIVEHINQLAPVLQANVDVILALQAGFIGAWGEWHSSSSGNETPAARAAVLEALHDALPAERQVLLRYPGDIIEQFPMPLPAAERFTTTDRARTGHHNDCFLANEHDAGTYFPPSEKPTFFDYLDDATPGMMVGGETCAVTPAEQRTDCTTALDELARFGWTFLNHDWWPTAIERWENEGCYDSIRKRLGYRFRLTEGTFPETTAPGEPVSVTLSVTNDGFAGLRNPRNVELVLRPVGGGTARRLPADVGGDPRLIFPDGGETATVTLTAPLPSDLPIGDYDLLLNLPDPAPRLNDRVAYSIRLANLGVWESATGYNDLGARLAVAPSTGARSVTMTSPADGSVLAPKSTVTLAATATGNPAEVTYFAGPRNLGSDASAPFALDKRVPNRPGTYTLTAEARYPDGQTVTSSGVRVQVGEGIAAQQPGNADAWAEGNLPDKTVLAALWPNPSSGAPTVRYTLATPASVQLVVVDLLGREVAQLVDETQGPGRYDLRLPETLTPGAYLVRFEAGAIVQTQSFTVLH